MPRNLGTGLFSLLPGYLASPNTTIQSSAQHNALWEDMLQDANTPRPIQAGGTGATTITGLKTALALGTAANYNVGNNGDTIPRFNQAGAWSANQQFQGITSFSQYIALSSGQIFFPNTQNPSSDPNTLDDYEEGTWTPTIRGGSSDGVGSYSVQSGQYIKIGQLVWISAQLVWASHSGVGGIEIGLLPFTAANRASIAFDMANMTFSSGTQVQANVKGVGAQRIAFTQAGPTGGLATLGMDTAANLYVAGCYQAQT